MQSRSSFFFIKNMTEVGIKLISKAMAYIAAFVLGAMMLLTVADVIGRYFFNHPINGAWEIIGFLLVCASTWGLAYCQINKGHIQVTILHDTFPAKIKSFITLIAHLMGLFAYTMIGRQALLLTRKYIIEKGHVTDTLEFPYFPFAIILMIGTGMLAVVLFIDFIHSLKEMARK